MNIRLKLFAGVVLGLFVFFNTFAQNPIIRNQFTADPTARVFGDKVYLYPSHDIPAPANSSLRKNWFCMEDYHVFSSENLTDWTDHGVIVSQNTVKWVDSTSYSMWAPDCICKNGKYYMYFPAPPKGGTRGFAIGVAVADNPEGPYIPQDEPIKGVSGIDPNVFIDKDGQAYLIWAMGKIFIAKLKDNMLELASEPHEITDLPSKGLKEGPFLFDRNGIYYLTYPHVENSIERVEYAIADNPMGPYKFGGVIMDESPTGCWTNHQSIIEFKGQWYLFYHSNDLSPQFDKNRSVRIDSLSFNADGTIRKVIPTLRGVGLTDATKEIQIDRYSHISDKGVTTAFLDSTDKFKGWKVIFSVKGAWLQYNGINFGTKKYKNVIVRTFSKTGGTLQLQQINIDASISVDIHIPKNNEWTTLKMPVSMLNSGVCNLLISSKNDDHIEIDWVKFE
jgi:hypothetical protein